jgi:hypothetical protein
LGDLSVIPGRGIMLDRLSEMTVRPYAPGEH